VKLFDVNVLVQAFREDAPDHPLFAQVLTEAVHAPAPFGLSRVAVSGFLRVVTNVRVFHQPAPIDAALEFCDDLIGRPGFRWVEPGPQHWSVFSGLCRRLRAEGNLIPDLWFAALAIESGSTWVTGDRDYGLVPGLDWQFIHR
jgi:toxin-antitoxin system PIN domain toxin